MQGNTLLLQAVLEATRQLRGIIEEGLDDPRKLNDAAWNVLRAMSPETNGGAWRAALECATLSDEQHEALIEVGSALAQPGFFLTRHVKENRKSWLRVLKTTIHALEDAVNPRLSPPNLLIYGEERHELSPKHWALLKILWDRMQVPVEEVSTKVWKDEGETLSDGALRTQLSRLNQRLTEIGIGRSYSVRSGQIIQQ